MPSRKISPFWFSKLAFSKSVLHHETFRCCSIEAVTRWNISQLPLTFSFLSFFKIFTISVLTAKGRSAPAIIIKVISSRFGCQEKSFNSTWQSRNLVRSARSPAPIEFTRKFLLQNFFRLRNAVLRLSVIDFLRPSIEDRSREVLIRWREWISSWLALLCRRFCSSCEKKSITKPILSLHPVFLLFAD